MRNDSRAENAFHQLLDELKVNAATGPTPKVEYDDREQIYRIVGDGSVGVLKLGDEVLIYVGSIQHRHFDTRFYVDNKGRVRTGSFTMVPTIASRPR